ncbi:hypothetical protein EOD42_02865 [Rhodovarius crocodyli]|uniref:DNA-binding protein n=1 Tax=Rhodovarius crocodyli TaxID=1979269 RepID=A0A437MN37_9PROT|nr:hypothetical protein EOD42_02865 [Rhodovarius crocodyli]
MPDGSTVPPNLSREAAVEWLHAQGFTHFSVSTLEKAAHRGDGPPRMQIGRFVYYPVTGLREWLTKLIQEGSRPRRRRRRGEPLD